MKGALMKRTIPLLATTMTLALLLVVGGVAVSQQRQELSTSSHSSTASDKSSGDVSIQSTKVKASFASGTGANFLGVKVSNHGNLLSFESPAGQEAVFTGREGYALCSGPSTVNGHDTGGVEEGFGTPKFKQPNPGKFPLTITRKTTDGQLQLKQVWSKPDAIEKDVTLTMTVKNLSNATIFDIALSRSGDFDVGPGATDQGARTDDSVWLWDEPGTDNPAGGLMLKALTFGTTHSTSIETASNWSPDNGTRVRCNPFFTNTPTARGDFAMRVVYRLSSFFEPGQSKTVKFE